MRVSVCLHACNSSKCIIVKPWAFKPWFHAGIPGHFNDDWLSVCVYCWNNSPEIPIGRCHIK